MTRLAILLQPLWPLVALVASLAMLAAAHSFERFGGLNPCALCLKQRDVYWGAAAIAALGFAAIRFWPRVTLQRAAAALLGLAFLTGSIVALYHVGVEQGLVNATCDVVDPSRIRAFDVNATFQAPNCDEIAWSMFGISMAGYNAMISLALATMSFLIAFAPAQAAQEEV
ncbi:MAG: disulfide bond formation protein B [Hyphomonadaceae bacterium]